MLETNIDDMNPEIYSYLIPLILDKGALDVYLTNIIMKKNRPAIKINVLCDEKDTDKFNDILFKETTSLGIRKYKIERTKLERKFTKVKTIYGDITIKFGFKDGKLINYSPEYEDLKKIAKEENIALKDLYKEAIKIVESNITNN